MSDAAALSDQEQRMLLYGMSLVMNFKASEVVPDGWWRCAARCDVWWNGGLFGSFQAEVHYIWDGHLLYPVGMGHEAYRRERALYPFGLPR